MTIKNVTVAGSGVLGAQIALQAAYHGFNVTVYDINDAALDKAKTTFERIAAASGRTCKQMRSRLRRPFRALIQLQTWLYL